ncbi:zinc-binding oxidoreductase CipB [Aspergillus unguis]
MCTTTTNTAAWLTEAKAHPFQLKQAPTYTPQENEILIKNHAVAINPIDGSLQSKAWLPLNYPTILGQDVAGEVVQVGPNVTRFAPGDRVLGFAIGLATKRVQDSAFQTYTILQSSMASEIPGDISYEDAAVVPVGLATASAGLFQDGCLNLRLPTEPRQKQVGAGGEVLLVWGGAGSVGSNAIQLGVAAGYEVVTTASPRNLEYVRRLGASYVVDYNSASVVEELVQVLEGKTLAGAMDCVGFGATGSTVEVVARASGKKVVATVKGGFEVPEGSPVTVKNLIAFTIKDNGVGKAVYEDYLPKALKAGTFVPAPGPLVVGKGLESVQAAVDRLAQGTSAQKVVVSL